MGCKPSVEAAGAGASMGTTGADAGTRPWLVDSTKPMVVAHRGLTGTNPAHTELSYTEAVDAGADYIEVDCICTKDGHLIVRHDIILDKTTNVASLEHFADRRQKRSLWAVDGDPCEVEGFFACDFTLDEIRELDAVEEFKERRESEDPPQKVLLLKEVMAILIALNEKVKRTVGIFIETKRARWHREELNFELEAKIIAVVEESGFKGPIVLQSFEPESVKYFQDRKPNWGRMRLLTDENSAKETSMEPGYALPDGIDAVEPFFTDIAKYAHMVGVWKPSVIASSLAAGDDLPEVSPIVKAAHKAGLGVVVYTFRDDRVPPVFAGDAEKELSAHFKLQVDGCFSDFVETAVRGLVWSSAQRLMLTEPLQIAYLALRETVLQDAYVIAHQLYPHETAVDAEQFDEVFGYAFDDTTPHHELWKAGKAQGKADLFEIFSTSALLAKAPFEWKLRFIFNMFDFDQSNSITTDELVILIMATCRGLCKLCHLRSPSVATIETMAKTYFLEMDDDHNGEVTFEEFSAFVKGHGEIMAFCAKFMDAHDIHGCMERLDRMVKDVLLVFDQQAHVASGHLKCSTSANTKLEEQKSGTTSNLQTVGAAMEHQSCSRSDVASIIRNFSQDLSDEDVNHIMCMMLREGDRGKNGTSVERLPFEHVMRCLLAFELMDANHDHELDKTELVSLIWLQNGRRPPPERIAYDLCHIDLDRSGTVDRIEWLEYIVSPPSVLFLDQHSGANVLPRCESNRDVPSITEMLIAPVTDALPLVHSIRRRIKRQGLRSLFDSADLDGDGALSLPGEVELFVRACVLEDYSCIAPFAGGKKSKNEIAVDTDADYKSAPCNDSCEAFADVIASETYSALLRLLPVGKNTMGMLEWPLFKQIVTDIVDIIGVATAWVETEFFSIAFRVRSIGCVLCKGAVEKRLRGEFLQAVKEAERRCIQGGAAPLPSPRSTRQKKKKKFKHRRSSNVFTFEQPAISDHPMVKHGIVTHDDQLQVIVSMVQSIISDVFPEVCFQDDKKAPRSDGRHRNSALRQGYSMKESDTASEMLLSPRGTGVTGMASTPITIVSAVSPSKKYAGVATRCSGAPSGKKRDKEETEMAIVFPWSVVHHRYLKLATKMEEVKAWLMRTTDLRLRCALVRKDSVRIVD